MFKCTEREAEELIAEKSQVGAAVGNKLSTELASWMSCGKVSSRRKPFDCIIRIGEPS